ncbi:hypothetical protein M426DRAFT_7697 [Hypoxylon sp. CI-4A]|nr:hypothetical protein M426DRAFT_7697 [Hypoxylon sp. CI-4A]
MSLEVIYVTRHGFRSAWNVDPSTGNYTAFIRSPTGLPTDPALVAHGVEQSNELAAHLQDVNPRIDQVYSSPYYRCMQTIHPFVRSRKPVPTGPSEDVSEEESFKIRVDLGLSEWYGLAHFEHPSSAPLNELQGFFPEIDATYESSQAPPLNGESLSQLHHRVATAVDSLIRRSDQEGHKAVLICTHAAVVIALGRCLTGQADKDFGAFTCGLSKYKRRWSNTIGAPTNLGTGTRAMIPAARDGRLIRETRSEDPARHVDLHQNGSKWTHLSSSETGTRDTGLYGGWACELDSDCSFLRDGEERGWKFSGDESFIETDENSSWSMDASNRSSKAISKTGIQSHDSHIDPAGGISKL